MITLLNAALITGWSVLTLAGIAVIAAMLQPRR
jgi:hypothetical protein